MISLDQVILLEEKVESAVKKIQQLQEENAALRTKCDELTNALSLKSEQLSNFTSDQSQIEMGIKKALERLDSIENSVLKNRENPAVQVTAAIVQTGFDDMQNVQTDETAESEIPEEKTEPSESLETDSSEYEEQNENISEENTEEPPLQEPQNQNHQQSSIITYNTPVQEENESYEEYDDSDSDDNQDGLGFDIF